MPLRTFALNHNGRPIWKLDELREYCDIDQLLIDYRDGRLCRWLEAQKNFDNLISSINNISAEEDLELAEELVIILDIDPQILAKVYFNRGVAYIDLKEYEKAIADYNKTIKLNRNYAEAYFYRGIAYDNLGEYQEALVDLTKAIALNPNYHFAYCNHGIVYSHLKEYKKAIADYNKAIKLNPDYAEAYFYRGIAYNHLGQYPNPKARADFTKAIKLNPDYAEAYFYHGFICGKLKEY